MARPDNPWRSLRLEAVRIKLERASVLSDRSRDVVWEPSAIGGLHLNGDLNVGPKESGEVSDDFGSEFGEVTLVALRVQSNHRVEAT